jgi:tetratricopeptide (TPR) repeat protein
MEDTKSETDSFACRLGFLLVVCGGLSAVAWLWWGATRRESVNLLPRQDPAEWVVYPSAALSVVHKNTSLATDFWRSFTLKTVPLQATLRIAAFREYSVSLNGISIAGPIHRGRNWKQSDWFGLTNVLRAGENRIKVTVLNSNGPPALWLALEADKERLVSDEAWEASCAGGAWRRARLASKPKVTPAGNPLNGGEQPWNCARGRWPTLLVFALVSAGLYWLWYRARDARRVMANEAEAWPSLRTVRQPGRLLLMGLVSLWVALFWNNVTALPSNAGFDGRSHMEYVRYIQTRHALPLAGEGWEMFQPPLYYVLCAALLGVLGLPASTQSASIALRVLGLGIGVGHLVVVWASLRLLFPGERSKPAWGVLLAAGLPPLLYLSQYITNEGLAAGLVSGCIYLTLRILRYRSEREPGQAAMTTAAEGISLRAYAGLGLCLGAALLTKATALLAVPAVVGGLALSLFQKPKSKAGSEGPPWLPEGARGYLRFLLNVGVMLAVCVIVCGWHYRRVWARYGTPLIGVWDARTGFGWWQDDGYRTSAYYWRFGEVLTSPWFGSFKSFSDGIYCTLWGDGLLGGGADLLSRPPWNYDLMAVGYWLALPVTTVVLVGSILALLKFLRRPSSEWFLLLGLSFAVGLAMIQFSLAVPYNCNVKAFYGMSALIPFCAFFVLGLEAVTAGGGMRRFVCSVLFGVWAMASYGSFWIRRSSAPAVISHAESLIVLGRNGEAARVLESALQREPHNRDVRWLLAASLLSGGDLEAGAKHAETLAGQYPDSGEAQLLLGKARCQQLRMDEAMECGRRAVVLAPGKGAAHEFVAGLLVVAGRCEEAIAAYRQALAVAPTDAGTHYGLGQALALRGKWDEAIQHYTTTLSLGSRSAEVQYNLGYALRMAGRLTQAVTHLEEALWLKPEFPLAHYNLGCVLAQQGRHEEAVAHLREALRLKADYEQAKRELERLGAKLRAEDGK